MYKSGCAGGVRIGILVGIVAAMLCMVDRVASSLVAAAPDDETAIRELVTKYARSITAADTTLASTIWATGADVSFIHPRGHEHGWEEVKTKFYEATMRELFSERQLAVKNVVLRAYGDAGWAEFYWDFRANLRSDGSSVTTSGRETQVYRKLNGQWQLVHVHYSEVPQRTGRQGL
jgi:ketosteroid isomerase-like protein